MRHGSGRLAVALGASLLLAACAPARLKLPSGEGEPFPAFQQAFQQATAACRDVRSLSAELAISGRAGGAKMRGRVTAGIAAPAAIRLEGAAPFGPPVFILAADQRASTLLLPRDNRFLRGEKPAAILDALVGLDLGPDDLLALLTGCAASAGEATGGRLYPNGWARVDQPGGSTTYLQKDPRDRWRVRATDRPGLRVEYEGEAAGIPSAARVVVAGGDPGASDLRIGLSQVELNVALAPEVFEVKLPRDAQPITLAELRQAGPMGDRR